MNIWLCTDGPKEAVLASKSFLNLVFSVLHNLVRAKITLYEVHMKKRPVLVEFSYTYTVQCDSSLSVGPPRL